MKIMSPAIVRPWEYELLCVYVTFYVAEVRDYAALADASNIHN